MMGKNRCHYFNGMEGAIDKFLVILRDIILISTAVATISITTWWLLWR